MRTIPEASEKAYLNNPGGKEEFLMEMKGNLSLGPPENGREHRRQG